MREEGQEATRLMSSWARRQQGETDTDTNNRGASGQQLVLINHQELRQGIGDSPMAPPGKASWRRENVTCASDRED